ncbi:MAG: gliding motility-associated C-terminal domain-containing protein [Bacteroidota bacterium]
MKTFPFSYALGMLACGILCILLLPARRADSKAYDPPDYLPAQPSTNTALFKTNGMAEFFNNAEPNNCASNHLCIRMTRDSMVDTVASVWYRSKVNLKVGFDFSICFNAGSKDVLGGKGIICILHNDTSGINAIGSDADHLGFDGISPSIGIELDTHQDDPAIWQDIEEDHIALILNGSLVQPQWGPLPIIPTYDSSNLPDYNIEDNTYHEIRITWDYANQYLRLFFDEQLRLAYQIDLIDSLFGGEETAFLGATSAISQTVYDLQLGCLQNRIDDYETLPEECLTGSTTSFDHWYQVGYPDFGQWPRSFAGKTVIKQVEASEGPTAVVSPFELINSEIRFRMRVDASPHAENSIGFLIGHQGPFGNNFDTSQYNEYDTWLFSWRAIDSNRCGYAGKAGFSLAKVNGTIPAGCAPGGATDYFFAQNNSNPNLYEIFPPEISNTFGWVQEVDYDFRITYTFSRMIIELDQGMGYEILYDIEGCFEPGRVGFFNLGQPEVKHNQFSYQYYGDFDIARNNICKGETTQFLSANTCLSNFDSTHIQSIRWDFGDLTPIQFKDTLITIADLNPEHTYNRTGNFPVTLIIENNLGCADTIIKTVIVGEGTPVELPPDTLLCAGDSLTLNPLTTSDVFFWNTGETTSSLTVTDAGTYSVSVASSNCPSSDEIIVDYNPALQHNIINSIPSCCELSNGEIDLLISGGTPPYQYQVDFQTVPGPSLSNLPKGIREILITDAVGCSYGFQVDVDEYPCPNFKVCTEDVSCEGSMDGLVTVKPDSTDLLYSLDGFNFSPQNTYTGLAAGDYTMYVMDANCIYPRGFTILKDNNIVLELTPDTLIQQGTSLQLLSTTNILSGASYSWQPDINISCLDCTNPMVSPLSTTLYTLTLTDAIGCTQSDSVLVTVMPVQRVYIPNVFSPNGDGLNDEWLIYAGSAAVTVASLSNLKIFNRWGELVYSIDDLFLPDDFTKAWDGRIEGEPAPQAVYVFLLNIAFTDGTEIFERGEITLIR